MKKFEKQIVNLPKEVNGETMYYIKSKTKNSF